LENLGLNYKGNEIASIQDIRNNNPNNRIKISTSDDSDDIKEVKNIEVKNENVISKNFTLKKNDATNDNDKRQKEETKKKKKKSFCSIL